ncbi:MAG: glutamate synthase-related protein [Pyrobaculum sp.]
MISIKVASYIDLVKHVVPEFWEPERVLAIRKMAETAYPVYDFGLKRVGRLLDRMTFKDLRPREVEEALKNAKALDVDVGVEVGSHRLELPIYVGDMSFGALSGNPNIAIAKAVTEVGAVAGIGEGGLHPEVAKYRNIVVQWASARFGMGMDLLRAGIAVNIKIGQGAKPGIGGHLPGKKVVEVIAQLRKIPVGSEAISPAPHHDIYSIEDLAQRVKALRDLTGKPVLVKVAAVNKIHYVSVGVARSSAEGIIIDGAGAGTGATPVAVRDHVGIPIDYAVPVVDSWLRRDGTRAGFLIIAGGMLYSPLDLAKIIALGADMGNFGTAALLAMGCIMCHACHTGGCPTALTQMIGSGKELDIEWGSKVLKNYLTALGLGLKAVLYALGMSSVKELLGRRDLLQISYVDEDVASTIGVELGEPGETTWVDPGRRVLFPREYYETTHLPITGMGGVVPGYTTPAKRILDVLRIEATQVTRPSVDPYREDVDVSVKLRDVVLDTPVVAPRLDAEVEDAAYVMGAAVLGDGCKYEEHCLSNYDPVVVPPAAYVDLDASLYIIDERLGGDVPLELAVARLDQMLRESGRRREAVIVAVGEFYNGADVYKLAALGADLVAPLAAFELVAKRAANMNRREKRTRYENLIFNLTSELKVLMGAGGVTSYYHTLVGNRDLLRSLDGKIARLLGVELAGR